MESEVTKKHVELGDAEEKSRESLKLAVGTGRWMSAVWFFRDGKLILHRTTFEFPRERFDEAVNQLRGTLNNERKEETRPSPEPLPRVEEFPTPEPESYMVNPPVDAVMSMDSLPEDDVNPLVDAAKDVTFERIDPLPRDLDLDQYKATPEMLNQLGIGPKSEEDPAEPDDQDPFAEEPQP